ncbi:kinase C-like protein [Vanrija pseudolonga]|uniref:Protein kinase C-like n=1 Tax=Vanrija pseudolonga TaxID=143232 RepID=A0AAF0YKE3_9TREE|nr:Protein kinase C-like [Vanrija pseudolonga]
MTRPALLLLLAIVIVVPPPNLPPSNPDIATLLQTIQSERRNLEGARAVMRAVQASSRNEAVIQQAQNEVRSAQVTIDFLEAELARLQLAASSAAAGPTPPPAAAGPSQHQQQQQQQYGYNGQLPAQYHSPRVDGPTAPLNINRADRERPLPPPPADDAQAPVRADKKTSQLDLLRYDAPLSGAKITRMLNQLNFKLQVEEQYKTGIEKMANAYRAEGDRRLRNETDAKRIESDGKIQLLRVAKKRYEKLAKFGSAVEEDEDLIPDSKRKEALRKPISGELVISLRGARELNHRPLPRRSSKAYSETYVVIKVEGTERAVSNLSRNDRWLEDFRIPVEKANEVEITIYDTVAPGDTAPIGMLWLRVSDLLEALRRQKVAAAEGAGEGWVTADKAASMGTRQGSAPDSATLHQTGMHRPQGGQAGEQKSEGIDGWWSVEPAGAISLRLDFVKDSAAGGRRPYEALGRQGAVRKRKGDVHEMNGHKFVQRQFYQPIKCALCEEFLLTGEGYQCEDCRYACHKKCYPKVVTKCVSKSDMDGEGDEEKINHRIPHRFQAYTNMSANWCCHCGYMLPFGRKNSVKCTECDITCHQTCSRLVPDFCGMTMEMANTLLKNLRDIKTTQGTKPPKTTYNTHTHQPSITYTPPKQEVTPPARPPPPPDAFGDPRPAPQGPPQLPTSQSYNNYASIQPPSSPSRPPRPSSDTQQQQQQVQHRLSFDGRDQQRPNLEINTNPPRVTTSPQPPPQQPQQPPQQPQLQQQYQPPTQQQRPQPAAGGYKPPTSMPGLTQTPTTQTATAPGRPAPPAAQIAPWAAAA